MLGWKPDETLMKANYKLGFKQERAPVDFHMYQGLMANLFTFQILDLAFLFPN